MHVINSILICHAITICIACNGTKEPDNKSSSEILREEKQSSSTIKINNSISNNGIAKDSSIMNSSSLKIEKLLAFNADIDEPFLNEFFKPEQWQMVYKTPKVFIGEYPILVFDSLQIAITDNSLKICTNCVELSATKQDTIYYFGAKPIFYRDDPQFSSWQKTQSIPCSFGELSIISQSALCYDTGTHTFKISSKSGDINTLNLRQNIIYFETDKNINQKKKAYLITYSPCGIWMNIFRISS